MAGAVHIVLLKECDEKHFVTKSIVWEPGEARSSVGRAGESRVAGNEVQLHLAAPHASAFSVAEGSCFSSACSCYC